MKVFAIKEYRKDYSVNTVTGEWEHPPYKIDIVEGNLVSSTDNNGKSRYLVCVDGEILYFDNVYKTQEEAQKQLSKYLNYIF